jgi:hypothetical protein
VLASLPAGCGKSLIYSDVYMPFLLLLNRARFSKDEIFHQTNITKNSATYSIATSSIHI